MGVFRQDPLRYRANLDGSNSATVFASVTGTRWVLTDGSIGYKYASGVSQFCFVETWDSVSTTFYRWDGSTTSGFYNFTLGPHGIQASAECSGLKIVVDVGCTNTGSYSVALTGYRTGG